MRSRWPIGGWLCVLALQTAIAGEFERFPIVSSDTISVQDRRSGLARISGVPWLRSNDGKLDVDPSALLVSAGRIRRGLLESFNLPSRGGDSIRFILAPSPFGLEEMRISPGLFTEGWVYEVMVPERMGEFEIVRGVVRVSLLELVNRGSTLRPVEIPAWLIEGLAMNARSSVSSVLRMSGPEAGGVGAAGLSGGGAILQSSPVTREYGANELLREAREFLRQEQPLTLSELWSAKLLKSDGLDRKRYQFCAQLLTVGLLSLPDGKNRMAQVLRALPQAWNWELVLFDVYQPYFRQPLDMEKWWSVNLTAFLGRDPAQVLSVESGLDKLELILKPTVKVWGATNELPVRENITLKQLLAEWDFSVQQPVLENTINQLAALQVNSTRALAPLVEQYRLLLQNYVRLRANVTKNLAARLRPIASPELIMADVFAGLDQLYLEREHLRRESDFRRAALGN